MIYKSCLLASLLIIFSGSTFAAEMQAGRAANDNWNQGIQTKMSSELTTPSHFNVHVQGSHWTYPRFQLQSQLMADDNSYSSETNAMHHADFGHHAGWTILGVIGAAIAIVMIAGHF